MGSSFSVAVNKVNTTVNQSVTSTFNATVTDSLSVSCDNTIIVDGATNCNIQFGEQYCSAIGTSTLSANISNQDTLTQDTYTSIKEKSTSQAGIAGGLINFSASYNGLDSFAKMAITSAKNMTVACSRDASGANLQQVKDCLNSTILIPKQTVTVEVLGKCSADLTNTTNAANTLQQMFDLSASATSGFQLWELVALLIVGGLVLILVMYFATKKAGGPLHLDALKNAMDIPNDPKNPLVVPQPQAPEKRTGIILLSLSAIFLIVWIGVIFGLNYPPAPFVAYGACTADRANPLKPNEFTNLKTVTVDGTCLEKGQPDGCEGDYRGYATCGIVRGVCNNPEVLDMTTKYKALMRACAVYGLYDNTAIPNGTDAEIANYIFSQYLPEGCTEFTKEGECSTNYTDCLRCTAANATGAGIGNVNFYAQNSLLFPEGLCGLPMNLYAYISSDENVGEAAQIDPITGNPAWTYNSDPNNALFTNICKNQGFQQRMKILNQYRFLINGVKYARNQLPTKFQQLNLVQACNLQFFDLLDKCDSLGNCDYVPAAGFENNPPYVASCKNELENCEDEDYIKDKALVQSFADKCISNIDTYNTTGWGVSIPLLLFFLVFLASGIAMLVIGYRKQKQMLDALTKQQIQQKAVKEKVVNSILSSGEKYAMAGTAIGGVLAAAIGGALIGVNMGNTEATTTLGIGYGVVSGGVLLLLLVLAYAIYKWYSAKSIDEKAQKDFQNQEQATTRAQNFYLAQQQVGIAKTNAIGTFVSKAGKYIPANEKPSFFSSIFGSGTPASQPTTQVLQNQGQPFVSPQVTPLA